MEKKDRSKSYWHLCQTKGIPIITIDEWCDINEKVCKVETRNPEYKDLPPKLAWTVKESEFICGWWNTKHHVEGYDTCAKSNEFFIATLLRSGADESMLYDYLEIKPFIPFTPSIMLNISPNWKGQYHIIDDDIEPHEKEYLLLENQRMEEALQYLIETYMRECQRFDYYDYVMEVGSEGTHLHAHIVGHVNPRLLKSVCGDTTKGSTKTSHFGKGNHVQQLVKISKGIKGIKGKITRFGIQSSILRKDYLVNDKIDYLYEDKKPEGHKNLYVLWDSPKHVCV